MLSSLTSAVTKVGKYAEQGGCQAARGLAAYHAIAYLLGVIGTVVALQVLADRVVVEATTESAQDEYTLQTLQNVSVHPRTATTGIGHNRSSRTVYDVSFAGGQTITCDAPPNVDDPFPVAVDGGAVKCQAHEWNVCDMKVSYDGSTYRVQEARGGMCDAIVSSTQKLYYDKKTDTISSTNLAAVGRLGCLVGCAVCLYRLAMATARVRVLTPPEFCENFSMETTLAHGICDRFAKQYDFTLKVAKQEKSYQASNKITQVVSGDDSLASDATGAVAQVYAFRLSYNRFLADTELWRCATGGGTAGYLVTVVGAMVLSFALAFVAGKDATRRALRPHLRADDKIGRYAPIVVGLIVGAFAVAWSVAGVRGACRHKLGLPFFDLPMIALS